MKKDVTIEFKNAQAAAPVDATIDGDFGGGGEEGVVVFDVNNMPEGLKIIHYNYGMAQIVDNPSQELLKLVLNYFIKPVTEYWGTEITQSDYAICFDNEELNNKLKSCEKFIFNKNIHVPLNQIGSLSDGDFAAIGSFEYTKTGSDDMSNFKYTNLDGINKLIRTSFVYEDNILSSSNKTVVINLPEHTAI